MWPLQAVPMLMVPKLTLRSSLDPRLAHTAAQTTVPLRSPLGFSKSFHLPNGNLMLNVNILYSVEDPILKRMKRHDTECVCGGRRVIQST